MRCRSNALTSKKLPTLSVGLLCPFTLTPKLVPLGFLTGLLGINVGGIPGADSKIGFAVFVVMLLVVIFFQIWFFKKKKWL